MSVVPSAVPAKSPGRLITEHEVLDEYFPEECRPTARWIRENVPHAIKIGRRCYFGREAVEDFLFHQGGETP